ncbi:hypothetical protein D9V79_00760 [Buchnera aphidicola (Stegophylla sp.)]|uniref:Uncharacterized protein n=1 Tax=Buchnera aphidicola (Stegophylla sp.) TaxID=2315800 RepID=A0A4D6YAV1_9GAMM|nr:hypothetical protein D9V79_00760 [Buchnera aphidicola (Stegophylla sp.)]
MLYTKFHLGIEYTFNYVSILFYDNFYLGGYDSIRGFRIIVLTQEVLCK